VMNGYRDEEVDWRERRLNLNPLSLVQGEQTLGVQQLCS
jgi:hypothetical protein